MEFRTGSIDGPRPERTQCAREQRGTGPWAGVGGMSARGINAG